MNSACELIERIEGIGGVLALRSDGQRIVYDVPAEAVPLLEELRANKDAVLRLLRERQEAPAMPPGIRLIGWQLKQPPIAIETCSVVMNPHVFAVVTLNQLDYALTTKRWTGWSIPQLVDRLKQVGVQVELGNSESICKG